MRHLRERSWRHPGLGSLAIAFACFLGSMQLLVLAAVIAKFAREDRYDVVGFVVAVAGLVVVVGGLAIWSARGYLTRGVRGWSTTACLVFLVLIFLVTGYLALASAG